MAQSALYAVYAVWEKEKLQPTYYGFAKTVDINSNKSSLFQNLVGFGKGFRKTVPVASFSVKSKVDFPKTVVLENPQSIKAWILLMRWGAKTGCHQLHERSLFFRGYQFPLCARCTGLFAGIITGTALFLLFLQVNIQLLFLLTGISVVLLGIDGFFQLKGIWVSTNFRRMVTGILCGFFVTGLFIRGIVMLFGILVS